MRNENLTIGEIDEGNLILHANRELIKIIRDIADPNKVATKERTLNITVRFKPNKQRNAASVKYVVTSKVATHAETESDIYLGKDKLGEPIAAPHLTNRQDLPFAENDEQSEAAVN